MTGFTVNSIRVQTVCVLTENHVSRQKYAAYDIKSGFFFLLFFSGNESNPLKKNGIFHKTIYNKVKMVHYIY